MNQPKRAGRFHAAARVRRQSAERHLAGNELVEIPVDVLKLARGGALEMKLDSKQFPKPGYCYVRHEDGQIIFSLYFDGGGERKLQVKNLNKDSCRVHAQWEFFIPQE